MFSILLRALLHPLDYFPVFFKNELILTEITEVSPDIYTFIFTPQEPLLWRAGQHAIFSFAHTPIEGKAWRPFSIASSPEEKVIRIATIIKEDPSAFKKVLKSLKTGDTITMHGPFGEMYVRPQMKEIVGVAGGIGITPFRALIKSIAHGSASGTSLTLIYSAVGDYTFKQEFDGLISDSIRIIYTRTPQEVNAELDALITLHHNDASYFISGSPGMIGAIRSSLKSQGIQNVVNDYFNGY